MSSNDCAYPKPRVANAVKLEMELSEGRTCGRGGDAVGWVRCPEETPDKISGSTRGPAARQDGKDCRNAKTVGARKSFI